MKFHVITAMYNCENNIADCVRALRAQSYGDFQAVIIDDMSTDRSFQIAKEAIDDDPRFKLIGNREKKHKTRNVVEGIQMACPADEDVIILVDGDDRLAHAQVLETVANTYKHFNCWMTYGSYCDAQGVRDRICHPYPEDVIRRNSYRSTKWLASHLKTFKYWLWKKLQPDTFLITEDELLRARWRACFKGQLKTWLRWQKIRCSDLLDSSGCYIRRCDDKAFSYPMLEMAGEKAVFINDILYVFSPERRTKTTEPVYIRDESEKWYTRLIRDVIEHRPHYRRLSGATSRRFSTRALPEPEWGSD